MNSRKCGLTIIIPTYDCSNSLENTLQSVFEQKDCNYECILVDGLSSDKTLEIAFHYKEKYPDKLTIISEKDNGIYDAMNKGVKVAQGKYIFFMGSGDTFINDSIIQCINNHDEDIVYGYVKTHDGEIDSVLNTKINFWTSFRYRPICHQAIFARRELLLAYPFELEYTYIADQAWILRMYSLHKKFKYIDKMIANYGYDGFSSSKEGRLAAVEEMDRAKRNYIPIKYGITKYVKKIFRIKGKT